MDVLRPVREDGEIEAAAAALHALRLLDDPEAQMDRRRGLDHLERLELDVLVAEVLEHAGAAAKEDRDEVDLELVDQPGGDELLADACPTHHPDGPASGGGPGLLQGAVDAAGHKV
jgi:hypothetical protein